MSMHSYLSVVSLGRWKMLKCGNWGSETKVLKPKYGSEKKSCLLVFSAFLIHGCVCGGLLAKRWLYPYNVGARSWDLGASVAITMHMTTSECGQTQTKTNGEWTNHAGSMLLMFSWQWCRWEFCHNFSPRIFIDGSTSYKTTPKILANSQHSLGLRARQDYTTLVPRLSVS